MSGAPGAPQHGRRCIPARLLQHVLAAIRLDEWRTRHSTTRTALHPVLVAHNSRWSPRSQHRRWCPLVAVVLFNSIIRWLHLATQMTILEAPWVPRWPICDTRPTAPPLQLAAVPWRLPGARSWERVVPTRSRVGLDVASLCEGDREGRIATFFEGRPHSHMLSGRRKTERKKRPTCP